MIDSLIQHCANCGDLVYDDGIPSALEDEAERLYGHLPPEKRVTICEQCYVEFKAWRESQVVH